MTDVPVTRRKKVAPIVANVELEAMFERILATQQPFFTALLNQIAAMESRIERLDASVQANNQLVAGLRAAELMSEVRSLETRLIPLENDHQQRQGMMSTFAWIPRVLTYVGALAIAAFGLWKYNQSK